jgi:large subunit ribosomal protein L22
MPYNYATKKYDAEHMAKGVGTSLNISPKHAIEICSALRNKKVAYAKNLLNDVIEEKRALPFTRFNSDVGHKKAIGPGRYPKKASKEILSLIECVEANAQFKGLNTSELMIYHICAHKAGKVMRYGRQRGRSSKRTHVEIMVKEVAKKSEKKAEKTKNTEEKKPSKETEKGLEKAETSQKEVPKAEPKKEEKKAEVKQEVPKQEDKK